MTYKVKAGDTLSKIAQQHKTTVTELVRLNKLKNKNVIYVGQVLIVSEPSEAVPTDSELAKAFRKCLTDIENLDSFKKLCDLL